MRGAKNEVKMQPLKPFIWLSCLKNKWKLHLIKPCSCMLVKKMLGKLLFNIMSG